MKLFSNRNGFTMIELLIAVGIISILASISLITLRNQSAEARDTRRIADLEQIRTALEFHRERFGSYPETFGRGTRWGNNAQPGWLGVCNTYDDPNVGTTGFVPDLAPEFINSLPRDPRTSLDNTTLNPVCTADQACYLYRSDGASYKLLAHCTHEEQRQQTDPYYDPCRPTWAMQISSNRTVQGIEDNNSATLCGGW